jgi:hypothetical protein
LTSRGGASTLLAMRVFGAVLAVVCGTFSVFACGSGDETRESRPRSGTGGEGGEGAEDSNGGEDGSGATGSGGEDSGGTTGNGGSGATGTGGASSGGEGGSGEGPTGNDLYVSPTGSDEDPGTLSEPFLTIAHAASIAQANDRIHLLDGTFDETTQPSFSTTEPISIPAGVTLLAENSGQAVLVGASAASSVALEFEGGGALEDVRFQSFRTAVRASSGELAISGLSLEDFTDPAASPLEFTGTVAVTVAPGAVDSYVSNGFNFATLDDSATLLVDGGSFDGVKGAGESHGIFHLTGDAELTLSAVDVLDSAGEVIFATDTAKVSLLDGTTIDGTVTPAQCNIELHLESELVLNDATLSNSFWAHISTFDAPTISIESSTLSNAGSWALIANTVGDPGNVSLTVDQSVIEDSKPVGGQIELRRGADVVITDTQIVDSLQFGIYFSDSFTSSFVLRDSTVTGSGQAGIRIGDETACDLGKVGDPGGNTLNGNGTASQPALLSYLPSGERCYAVGNTWLPDAQGASPSGTYTATGAGAVVEFVGLKNDGLNFWIIPAGSIVRVAENP